VTTLRDDLLPVADELRQLPVDFGLRRYTVTIRRRIWSGTYPGDGTATNQDIALSPLPRVRNSFSSASLSPAALQYILANGNVIDDRYYKIDRITPAYNDGTVSGGYTAQQLRLRPSPDSKSIEEIVVLVGDDGMRRDCVQVTFEQDRAFRYTMLVHESDRPRVALSSLAITPVSPSVVHGNKVQLMATGTFADGTTSDLTPLVVWSSATPAKATVDVLGNVTAVAAGTSVITAALADITATDTVTVT
jgi:hypothetical protein